MIKQLQRNAVMRDPGMAAAHLTGAQAEAMIAAANNDGGAMAGFMGMSMAAQAGGVNASQLYQMNEQNKQAQMAQLRCKINQPMHLVHGHVHVVMTTRANSVRIAAPQNQRKRAGHVHVGR